MTSLYELVVQKKDELDWDMLSYNPSAMSFLEENTNNINWRFLSYNPGAIYFIEEMLQSPELSSFVQWDNLSRNSAAIHLLEKHPDRINWGNFSLNEKILLSHLPYLEENKNNIIWKCLSISPYAIPFLKANPHRIDWVNLSRNPAAIEILEANPDRIDWYYLSGNSAALDLLEANPDKIYLDSLCSNSNKDILDLIPEEEFNIPRYHPSCDINWHILSSNPAAIDILEAYPDKIDWRSFSANPHIRAIELLEQNIEKVNMHYISQNQNNYIWSSFSYVFK